MTRKLDILTFIKVGPEKYMRDLYENGTIFCQPRTAFAKTDDTYRGDKWETINYAKALNTKEISFFKGEERIATMSPTSVHAIRSDKNLSGNLYCLYALRKEDLPTDGSGFRFNSLIDQFGSHFVLIQNNQRFIDRLIGAIRREGYNIEYDMVDYIDTPNFSGPITPFKKRDTYAYQKEFRILIHNSNAGPLIFNIGPLKDIALLLETKDMEKMELKPI